MSQFRSLILSALVLVSMTIVGFTTALEHHELCHGFVPENNMKIPVGWVARLNVQGAQGGLNEAQFNSIMDRMEKIYGPVVTQAGGTLQINRLWTDETVNASAERNGNIWILNMYGGLARHKDITMEGMALVICHEMGHHLGGAPKIEDWYGDAWATDEGGADYYATLKCLRNFFAEDDNESIVAAADSIIEQSAKDTCKAQFASSRADELLCLRSSMAGESVAGLFMDLKGETTRPMYNTPDTTVVTATNDDHPATQCRMDTYFAGAICAVSKDAALSDTDYKAGSCVQGVDALGYRPLCWFKPN